MEAPIIVQGRERFASDIKRIRKLRRKNPDWNRYRLSRELADAWNWHNDAGQLKDIACRSLLRKLAHRGRIDLRIPRIASPNRFRHKAVRSVDHQSTPIDTSLRSLWPLQFLDLQDRTNADLFAYLLSHYHCLGFRQYVGENRRYLVASNDGRVLACVLFGAAAWKCAVRDDFIGWDNHRRERHFRWIANNHRFLILPWVQVSCLASPILGLVSRRVSADWESRYGRRIVMLETFVDRERFRGSCHRVSNWHVVGQTRGRSRRQDQRHQVSVPIKDVYVYPLRYDASMELCG